MYMFKLLVYHRRLLLQPWLNPVFPCAAYETLSDETRRREYEQSGVNSAYFTKETQGRHRQPFTFNFDDIFKDFDIYSQNRHARHRRHFDEHSRSHKETHSRHKRHFQGGFGAGIFDDMFDEVERMFTFDGHNKKTENQFHGASKQHCRTVTQRRGNMVTTYTDCTASWDAMYTDLWLNIALREYSTVVLIRLRKATWFKCCETTNSDHSVYLD